MTADKTLLVNIISQSSVVLTCRASLVTMPGEDGEFGVMPMHAKLIANLSAGVVTITSDNNQLLRYFVDRAIATISEDKLDIITEFALNLLDNKQYALIYARINNYRSLLKQHIEQAQIDWLNNILAREELALGYIAMYKQK